MDLVKIPLLIGQGREQVAHGFGQYPQCAMDVESATSHVKSVEGDSGMQETHPKQLKSGGTERLPDKSTFAVTRVQRILKADKVCSSQYLSLSTRGDWYNSTRNYLW